MGEAGAEEPLDRGGAIVAVVLLMKGKRRAVGEIDSFITMLLVACENEMVYDRLESLLSLPDSRRQGELNAWVSDLLVAQAPRDFITAIACLLDNQVAEKAYEVIYKCRRGERI